MRRPPLLISNQGMWNQHSVPNSFVALVWEFPLKCKIKAVSSTSTLLMQKSLIAKSLCTLPAQNKRASKNWLHKASSLGFWLFFSWVFSHAVITIRFVFPTFHVGTQEQYFWWSFCWTCSLDGFPSFWVFQTGEVVFNHPFPSQIHRFVLGIFYLTNFYIGASSHHFFQLGIVHVSCLSDLNIEPWTVKPKGFIWSFPMNLEAWLNLWPTIWAPTSLWSLEVVAYHIPTFWLGGQWFWSFLADVPLFFSRSYKTAEPHPQMII